MEAQVAIGKLVARFRSIERAGDFRAAAGTLPRLFALSCRGQRRPPLSNTFDFAPLLRARPPAAAKWNGLPKYNFIGGHNDADALPVDALVAAATAVLRREGRTLATYGLNSGPLGYRPLREFLAGKLKGHAGIDCSPDEILITSGSLQGLDLVNSLLLAQGRHGLIEQETYRGALTSSPSSASTPSASRSTSDGMRMDALKQRSRS